MIPFFRKIRKKKADDNKPMKYMRYAVGEIVLVMIGILLALQVNNWNEERKSRLKSKIYIEKLITDLVSDTLNINEKTNKGLQSRKNIRAYFDFFEKGNSSISKLVDSAKSVERTLFRYLPVDYTFKDMQSSGNTGLLNEKQRRALVELSNEQEFMQIIIEKVIADYYVEWQGVRKYSDQDLSSVDFFKTLAIEQDEQAKIQGLLHQHNMLTILDNLARNMESGGERIKLKTNFALNLLLKKEN